MTPISVQLPEKRLPWHVILLVVIFLAGCGNESADNGPDGGSMDAGSEDRLDASSDTDTDTDTDGDSDNDADADADTDSGSDSGTGDVGNWVVSAGSSDNDEAESVQALDDGSSIVCGHFHENVTFGKGDPNETTLNSAGWTDAFWAKYNPDGTLAWSKQAGSARYEYCNDVSALEGGSFIATGYFETQAKFGAGEPNETNLWCVGSLKMYVAAFEADGSFLWAKCTNTTVEGFSIPDAVSVLPDGSSVVTGHYKDQCTFGPLEPNAETLTSMGERDGFVARYNADGTIAWASTIGSPGDVYPRNVAVLEDGSAIVAGTLESGAIFGEGEDNETIINIEGFSDIFIARYESDGTLAWAKQAGGDEADNSEGLTLLDNDTFLVAGQVSQNAVFAPGETNETTVTTVGSNDMFIAEYDMDGKFIRVILAGGDGAPGANAVSAYQDGSFVVTGSFSTPATFGADEPNETILNSAGQGDIFVARYNADGTLAWAGSAGGADRGDVGNDLAALDDSGAIVTGTFSITSTFFTGEPDETSLQSAGLTDIFLMHLKP